MAKLIAQSGHSLDLPLRRVTLGESPACDIPLASSLGLAPCHFEIEPGTEGNYVIRDLSGGKGLHINGQPVQECIIQHGNVITAGNLSLGFWSTEEQRSVESPFLAAARRATNEEASHADPPDGAKPASYSGPPAATAEDSVQVNPSPVSVLSAVAVEPEPADVSGPPPMPAGPPIAWHNPADENKTAAPPPAVPGSIAGHHTPAVAMKYSERLRRRIRFAGRRVAALGVVACVAIGAAGALRIPAVQAWVTPHWTQFMAWVNPPPPVPRTAPPGAPAATVTPAAPGVAVAMKPGPGDSVTPRTEHNEIVKRLLTERTTSLFQADLSQLIPFYNANASSRNLPPQREMTEAFRKHYGITLDGFQRLTCLRASGKDEFVFVLTADSRLNIESLLGIPERSAAPDRKPLRIYPVKTTGRVYGVAQFDPFTIVLGKQSWIDASLNNSAGPALREATCMFPDTASRNPGALIMVERLSPPPGNAPPLPFSTSISNLFFENRGESRLTLTRNPDVKEETFVEHSSEALKEQSRALLQAVKLSNALAVSTTPASGKSRTLAADSGEIINTTEASIVIPDGEALLREAIDAVAHTFMSQSPSVELILAAQKAVLNFNQASLNGAVETRSVASVAEALELLQNGIVIRRGEGERDLLCQIERLENSQADEIVHLLAIEEGGRMVFRPNPERLGGTLLDLAVKARDYRNAELIISLWNAAKFKAGDFGDTQSAARKVIEWADGPGARQRLSVGLPALTEEEYRQAVALLSLQDGQLKWRPGEEGYRTWLRKVSPDPKGDARKIALIFQEAQRAGAIPHGRVSELSEAVHLINSGVRPGAGSRGPFFNTGNLTTDELRAAARYLRFERGSMSVVER